MYQIACDMRADWREQACETSEQKCCSAVETIVPMTAWRSVVMGPGTAAATAAVWQQK